MCGAAPGVGGLPPCTPILSTALASLADAAGVSVQSVHLSGAAVSSPPSTSFLQDHSHGLSSSRPSGTSRHSVPCRRLYSEQPGRDLWPGANVFPSGLSRGHRGPHLPLLRALHGVDVRGRALNLEPIGTEVTWGHRGSYYPATASKPASAPKECVCFEET